MTNAQHRASIDAVIQRKRPSAGQKAGFVGAEKFLPRVHSLRQLRAAVQSCRGCDLYKGATQAVFGAGGNKPSLMLVGEQPGDQEDKQGRPFVGPAGALLHKALAEAGIAEENTYFTNAVKHFRWVASPRGKRRLHKSPGAQQIAACHAWLACEVEAIAPRVIVLLGAAAGMAFFGRSFRVGTSRGRLLTLGSRRFLATIHPSAVLRSISSAERAVAFRGLVTDLQAARAAAA